MGIRSLLKAAVFVFLSLSLTGCTFIFQKGRRSDVQKIEELNQQLNELESAKSILEERLAQEIKDKQVSLKMMEKGLVVTFVADVLFDSGKATIKPQMYSALDKVAVVLRDSVPDLSVGIEGHTDNQPIKHSGWKSNWQLSTARAQSVLDYLADKRGIAPERLSIVGYGEYRPIATNATKEGRQLNRRVEIVILPKYTKVKEQEAGKPSITEPTENLK